MNEKLLNIKDVKDATGLSETYIYKLMKEGKFPTQIKLSRRAVRWKQSEVQNWLKNSRSMAA